MNINDWEAENASHFLNREYSFWNGCNFILIKSVMIIISDLHKKEIQTSTENSPDLHRKEI